MIKTPFQQVTPETRIKLGRWLADKIHDMKIDEEQIDREQGPDFLPALRGLEDYLFAGEDPLYKACRAWRSDNCVTEEKGVDSPEVKDSLPGLAESVCAIIGYWDDTE